MESGQYNLNCNHGIQNGVMCECEDGWMSSGVHESDLLSFYWCDQRMVDKASIQMEPMKLSIPMEILLVIVS